MRTSRARSLLILAATALLTGAITLGAFFGFFRPSGVQAATTVLTVLSGDVYVREEGGTDVRLATDGQGLHPGDTVRTARDARAVVTYLDGSTTELEPETEITIKQDAIEKGRRSIHISQVLGTTWHHVMSVVDGSSDYEVETPAAVAGVRDTLFQVTVVRDGTTTVKVNEGTVAVRAAGGEVLAGAGQETTVRPGEAPSAPVSSPAPPSEIYVRLGSPAWFIVTDPAGRSVGVVPPGVSINQTPGAQSDEPVAERQDVVIPSPQGGTYVISIEAKGTGGAYVLTAGALADKALVFLDSVQGTVQPGERWEVRLTLAVENGRVVSALLSQPSLANAEPTARYVVTDLAAGRARGEVAQVLGSEATPTDGAAGQETQAAPSPGGTAMVAVAGSTPTRTPPTAAGVGPPPGPGPTTPPGGGSLVPTATSTLVRPSPTPTRTPIPPCTVRAPSPVAGTVGIGSATASSGCTVTIDIVLDTGGQGVTTLEMNVDFDLGRLEYQGCTASRGVCNLIGPGTVYVSLASATPLTGVVQVGTITFRTGDGASGCVTLSGEVTVYAGGIPPSPLPLPPVNDGQICIS